MEIIWVGIIAIIFGSEFVVNSATIIAKEIGVSERIIGLTIIALGTSLPELVTTIISSIKGEQDILVGNIIGSNIFNICMVLGVPVSIFGAIKANNFTNMDLIFFILSAAMLFVFSISKKKINRFEGALMLATFAIYYTVVFVL